MKPGTLAPDYSLGEEIANSVIHGIGALLAIGGLVVLVAFAAMRGDAWHVVGCSIFGASLVLLYMTSTLYHAIQHRRAKQVLRILDHSAIFLLIAGTYTPFLLVNLRGPWGWALFGVVWTMALLGIYFKVTKMHHWHGLSLVLYVVMGWLAVVAVKPMLSSVDPGGLMLLLLGGVAYTGGVFFYRRHDVPYNHAVWHLFVLTGSVFHYFAVLYFVIPDAAMV